MSQQEDAIKSQKGTTPSLLADWLNLKRTVTLNVVKNMEQPEFSHIDDGV